MNNSGRSFFVIFSYFSSFYFCRLKGGAEKHTFTHFTSYFPYITTLGMVLIYIDFSALKAKSWLIECLVLFYNARARHEIYDRCNPDLTNRTLVAVVRR